MSTWRRKEKHVYALKSFTCISVSINEQSSISMCTRYGVRLSSGWLCCALQLSFSLSHSVRVCMFAVEIDSVTYELNECYSCEKWNMAQKSKSNVKQEWEKNIHWTHKHAHDTHGVRKRERKKEEEWKKQQSRNNCVCAAFDTIYMELYDINVQFAYKTR